MLCGEQYQGHFLNSCIVKFYKFCHVLRHQMTCRIQAVFHRRLEATGSNHQSSLVLLLPHWFGIILYSLVFYLSYHILSCRISYIRCGCGEDHTGIEDLNYAIMYCLTDILTRLFRPWRDRHDLFWRYGCCEVTLWWKAWEKRFLTRYFTNIALNYFTLFST